MAKIQAKSPTSHVTTGYLNAIFTTSLLTLGRVPFGLLHSHTNRPLAPHTIQYGFMDWTAVECEDMTQGQCSPDCDLHPMTHFSDHGHGYQSQSYLPCEHPFAQSVISIESTASAPTYRQDSAEEPHYPSRTYVTGSLQASNNGPSYAGIDADIDRDPSSLQQDMPQFFTYAVGKTAADIRKTLHRRRHPDIPTPVTGSLSVSFRSSDPCKPYSAVSYPELLSDAGQSIIALHHWACNPTHVTNVIIGHSSWTSECPDEWRQLLGSYTYMEKLSIDSVHTSTDGILSLAQYIFSTEIHACLSHIVFHSERVRSDILNLIPEVCTEAVNRSTPTWTRI